MILNHSDRAKNWLQERQTKGQPDTPIDELKYGQKSLVWHNGYLVARNYDIKECKCGCGKHLTARRYVSKKGKSILEPTGEFNKRHFVSQKHYYIWKDIVANQVGFTGSLHSRDGKGKKGMPYTLPIDSREAIIEKFIFGRVKQA